VPIATTFYNKIGRNVALKMLANSTVDEMAFTTSNKCPERGEGRVGVDKNIIL
jgi:hypothetical protein